MRKKKRVVMKSWCDTVVMIVMFLSMFTDFLILAAAISKEIGWVFMISTGLLAGCFYLQAKYGRY